MTKDPNENRPGYKKTKVGWIPKDWECNHLHQYSSKIGSGCTPKGGRLVYLNEGIPFVRSQNVHNGTFMHDGLVYISEKQHKKMKGTEVHPFDLLYTITGASIGRCCIFPKEIKEANVNQHVCIVRVRPEILSSEYLCALFNSDVGRKQLYDNQAGGGREGLNFENLRSYRIPAPLSLNKKRSLKYYPHGMTLSSRPAKCLRQKNASKKPSCSNYLLAKNVYQTTLHLGTQFHSLNCSNE